jgi:ferredoxin/flavodoxin
MKTIIYYFTATGNCLNVSRNIQKSLKDSELISIPSLSGQPAVKPEATRFGIVFPVYDYTIPLVIRDFIKKMDISYVSYIFAVCTCNFLPGLALEHIDDLLKEKGSKLNSGFIIRMPGNYISMYGANSIKTQEKKFRDSNKKIITITDYITKNKDYGLDKSKFIIDRLLAPKFQKSMESFYTMDKNFSVDNNCNHCGICQKVCAFDNILMVNSKPQWQHKCQQCFACIELCPKTSIQIGKATVNRKRYKNPEITLQDIIQSSKHE